MELQPFWLCCQLRIGRRPRTYVDRTRWRPRGLQILEKGTQLVYGRTFEGWTGDGSDYFELLQEYSHLEDVHWRREHGSYCRFDDHGDWTM